MPESDQSPFTQTPSDHLLLPVWADEHVIVVNKPANLLTTPGRGPDKQDCLYHRLLPQYPNARVVHRLDMATSGLVMFALSHSAQVALGRLFELRQITKTYEALVSGRLAKREGEVDAPLICDWPKRPLQKVCTETGKPAQTRYTRLDYDGLKDVSRVALQPLTGRSHQLRVHMLSLGHPIVGDVFYHPDYQGLEHARLHLHARELSFTHPITEKTVFVSAATPF